MFILLSTLKNALLSTLVIYLQFHTLTYFTLLLFTLELIGLLLKRLEFDAKLLRKEIILERVIWQESMFIVVDFDNVILSLYSTSQKEFSIVCSQTNSTSKEE